MKPEKYQSQQDSDSTELYQDENFFDSKKINKHLPYEHRKKAKKHWRYKIISWLLVSLIFLAIGYGGFFAYKIYSVGKKVNVENIDSASFLETLRSFTHAKDLNLEGVEQDRINILLLGIAGKGKPGQFLTDTIMIASLDTKNNRVALLSIPRDLYVEIPGTHTKTKINSIYQYDVSESKDEEQLESSLIQKTISNITGLPIHYYVVMNFDGFQKVVDDIGGVNIMNARDIFDASYPGPNYSYETFELAAGFHHLDGATALKYARERHNDPEGDFGRAKRQQQIMQATKNKIFSAGTMLNVFTLNNLFDTLGENIQTNINSDEIASFFELIKRLDTNNINNVVVDAWNKDSLLKVSHVQYGDVRAFVLVPRVGNYSEIQDLAKNIFDLNALKRRQEAIAAEDTQITIINRSGNMKIMERLKKVLQENLNYRNVAVFNEAGKLSAEKTIVYDMTDGQKPFTLDEIATKLPATVSYTPDSSLESFWQEKKTDLILVIGKDLISRYTGEEGTLEDLNNFNDNQEAQDFTKN